MIYILGEELIKVKVGLCTQGICQLVEHHYIIYLQGSASIYMSATPYS
jgi:hypothetical protein